MKEIDNTVGRILILFKDSRFRDCEFLLVGLDLEKGIFCYIPSLINSVTFIEYLLGTRFNRCWEYSYEQDPLYLPLWSLYFTKGDKYNTIHYPINDINTVVLDE